MTQLNVSSIKDLTGSVGFTLGNLSITSNGSLVLTNPVINGPLTGTSAQYLPSLTGNDNKYLTTNGTSASWGTFVTDSGPIQLNWYTSSSTWNRPSGVKRVIVHIVGSGGGGSGYGESGGAGGYSTAVIDVTSISSVAISIGGRGGGTGYSSQGGRGGTTSFGPYLSAEGGYGANQQQQHAGGVGGYSSVQSGISGMLSYGGGGDGHDNPSGIGRGGNSFFGGSGAPGHSWHQFNRGHQDHAAWGAGGSSGRNGDTGSDGRQGVCVVYSFK